MDGPRPCTPADIDEVMGLINRVFREGSDQRAETDYPLVYDPAMMRYQRIVKVDGRVVAHVPVAPREVVGDGDRFTVGLISATLSHPDYRRQGYATLCLLDCIRTMDESGWPLSTLWTMERTFPFYQHSGYEAVASQGWVYTVGPADLDLFEDGSHRVIEYDPADPRHLDSIIDLHEREPDRIARSRSDYAALLTLPKITTYLAEGADGPGAYLMHGQSTNKPGLIEAGGDRRAVEALVRHVLQRVDGDIQAITTLTPSVLDEVLDERKPDTRRPVEQASGVGHQMHRINSLGGLLRGIEGHLGRQSEGLRGQVSLMCDDSGEVVSLRLDDGRVAISDLETPDTVTLTRRQLTQLVFGAHAAAEPVAIEGRAGELLSELFPYYFPIWELDHC